VIPVYNNILLTKQCISSILQTSANIKKEFEIIIIDDCSYDSTQNEIGNLTRSYPSIKYHRNKSRQDFAGSCNKGAALAMAPYIIFLNNDTIVHENWELSLLDTIKQDDNIWIVGSKLLFANKTIQHAGVAFRDISFITPIHLYKFTPEHFPLTNIQKDLHCVTGACFIIRKLDFETLGGFDEQFQNGFEDVDLCLKIKRLGKRIIYQPQSVITHLESQSDGRNKLNILNFEKLKKIWNKGVQKDAVEIIKKDISLALEKGLIQKEEAKINRNPDDTNLTTCSENVELNEDKTLTCHPSANQTFINLLLAEINPEKHYILALRYSSIKGNPGINLIVSTSLNTNTKYSDNVKSQVNKGQEYMIFYIPGKIIKDSIRIQSNKINQTITIKDLSLYSYDSDNPDPPKCLNLIVDIRNKTFDLKSTTERLQNILSLFRVNLILIDNKTNDYPDSEIVKNLSVIQILSDSLSSRLINDLINKYKADYILNIPNYINLEIEFIEDALAKMEINPNYGFVYSDIIEPGTDPATRVSFEIIPISDAMNGPFDIQGLFRHKCWEDAGGFDNNLSCYFMWDMFIKILHKKNWESCKSGIDLPGDPVTFSSAYDPDIDYIKDRILVMSQNSGYILEENEKLYAPIRNRGLSPSSFEKNKKKQPPKPQTTNQDETIRSLIGKIIYRIIPGLRS